MATVSDLSEAGALFKLDPALDPDVQELRCLYTSERLKDWIQQTLPTLGSAWEIDHSPVEQLDALVATFASGEQLTFGWQFSPLKPIGQGVWELKTADLRVFGWFPVRDYFIGVAADWTERIKLHGLYAGYRGEIVRFRDELRLDEPKFIEGDNPDDVVSNFTFPE